MLPLVVVIATVPPLFRSSLGRPVLSGPELTQDLDGFRIHYTAEGPDAVDESYLSEVQRGLVEGQAIFEEEGWPRPLPDNGEGGNDAIDVYILELDANGYANPVDVGNNDSSCYIRLDPKLPPLGGVIASVARHELHHCIQFRYRTNLPSWLYESGATYEQYSHAGDDPVLEAAAATLWASRLSEPERRLGNDQSPYATFLWSKFWAEYTGYDPERLVGLWEALQGDDHWANAMEEAAQDAFGESLDEVFLQYAVHNRFACANDDGQHYLDEPLPCVADVSVPTRMFEDTVRIEHDERRFTAAYFDISASETENSLGIHCAGVPGTRSALVTVNEDGERLVTATEDPWTGTLWVRRGPGEGARLIVAGTEAKLDATCVEVPKASAPRGCSTAPRGTGILALACLLTALRSRRAS
ncbi:MAG: hypothetical protein AAGA48_36320 [Myxococcota bacterium]